MRYARRDGLNHRRLLRAKVILTSSIAGVKGLQAHDTYSAAKAAVRSLARTWTVELKDRGRVNVISPGAIDTPIIDSQVSTAVEADALRARLPPVTTAVLFASRFMMLSFPI